MMFSEADFESAFVKVRSWPIWDKFTVVDSGCWEWTAAMFPNGYGCIAQNGKPRKAHRIVYEFLVGPIPPGLHIDHLCRNRRCVNPEHLEPVTPRENNRRAAAVRTQCPSGHAFDSNNTHIDPRGARRCRTCRLINNRKARAVK